MPKFFVEPFKVKSDKIIIDTDDVSHIVKVLRHKTGDFLTVCDGEKNDYICRISEISREFVVCDIIEKCENDAEPSVSLTLCLALPKGDKADFVVQKAVELGASRIVMFEAENSVSKAPSDERAIKKKVDKWQKTALAAAKQCGRGIIPEVLGIFSFSEAMDIAKSSERIVFLHEKEKHGKIDAVSWHDIASVSLFVGPEGGFCEEEAECAKKCGALLVTLGNRILRLETAAVCAVSVIMHITHNL